MSTVQVILKYEYGFEDTGKLTFELNKTKLLDFLQNEFEKSLCEDCLTKNNHDSRSDQTDPCHDCDGPTDKTIVDIEF